MDADFLLRALLGLGTLAVGVGGWLLSKRGRQDTLVQQKAATALQERINTVVELEKVVSSLKEERDYFKSEVVSQRSGHSEAERVQATRCAHALDQAIDQIATLQTVVTDEIAKSSSVEQIKDAQLHMTKDHARVWGESAGEALTS